ncbi:hypothetical protein KJA13_03995 [Patescibacteria group bacterium]|nr:hypothetical protein [Patescibacteria group bacterium]
MTIPDYVKYIFNSAIALSGLLAFIVLLWSGVQYFTSAGKPEIIKSAKSQIKSAFIGLLILFFSYLILITINPQLISFYLPGIPQIPEAQLPQTPISPLATSDLLGRIKEMAKVIKKIPDEINNMAERIQELTNKCDCGNTQPLCFCTGGSSSSSCQPRGCYAGPGFQPCPDEPEIKENQKRIIAWKDEILYYRNRALSEVEDLKDSVEKILNEEISWYNQKITAEQELLTGIQDDVGREQQQKLINYLIEQRDWLIEERDYKEDLKQTLNELADKIKEIEPFISEIGALPDKCLYDEGVYGVNNKCNASCKGKCHDYKYGCEPVSCDGGNPCPVGEINDQLLLIQGLRPQIINKCDEIISIIDNIKETKEKEFQL